MHRGEDEADCCREELWEDPALIARGGGPTVSLKQALPVSTKQTDADDDWK